MKQWQQICIELYKYILEIIQQALCGILRITDLSMYSANKQLKDVQSLGDI